MQFSPKILGLNIGIFKTVFGQSETEFSDFVCCFYVCCFYVLLPKKWITCWLCENHVTICLFDVLT